MIKVVACHFEGNDSLYSYKTDLDLKKGDVCIVENTNGKKAIVKVYNGNVTNPNQKIKATCWVLMVITKELKESKKRVMNYGLC